jgi:CHAT domain-containing protein
MNRRRGVRNAWYAGLAALVLLPSLAAAQGDPLVLQQQAIRRLDAFIDHFRKTGDLQSRLPDLAQAEAELAASNRMLAARGQWSALALGLTKHGHVYRMQAQWPKAIELYQVAEQAAQRGRDVVRQADALAWRALAESSRRNLGQAFADSSQAVRLAETTDDKEVLARALDVLGTVQIAQRDLAGAADTLNREVEVARQVKDPMAAYYAYLNRSDVYLKAGERCDFQRAFEPCYQALDRARADLDQALAIVRERGYGALARQTQQFIGNVEARRQLVKSQESMHQSLQKTDVFRPRKPGDVLVTGKFGQEPMAVPPLLAQIYQESKRYEQQAGGFAYVAQVRSQYVEGLINAMQGNRDIALAFFLKAVDTLERDRRGLRDERSRGAFLEDRIEVYYAPIRELLDRGRHDEAFELFERARSRALADLLATRKLGLARPEEQKLYTEWTVLRTQIADAQGMLFDLASEPDATKNAPRVRALHDRIRALETQEQAVVGRMSAEAPRLRNLAVSTPPSLKALQQSMREERYEVLQYLVLEHGVIVWHIAADSVVVRNVFLPRTEVMRKVAALRTSLADRDQRFDETTARELFLFLVQPVLSRIRSERLVIIPHEDLTYVPFQALQDPADGRYLGDRVQITYAPSTAVLLGLRRSASLAGGRVLAIADPDISAAGPEVQAIAQLFPGRSKVVTDDLAQEKDVKAWIRDVDVVHLAVHGKFNTAEPMLSYLALAAGGGDDGKLTAAEMFGLPLDRSRLVVLSACETGRAAATHGNELLGMTRGLLYGGAGSLVLSYWKVDSEATAIWMRAFYDAALTRPLPEAARTALLKVKSHPSYGHPYFWAAFAMIGR